MFTTTNFTSGRIWRVSFVFEWYGNIIKEILLDPGKWLRLKQRHKQGINKCSCIRCSELWNFVSHSIFRYSSDIDRYQWFSLYIVLSTFSKLVNKLQLNWWFDLCFGMFHGLIMELVKHDVPWTFKGYLRYKTTTFQNVPSEAQAKNFFIS